MPRRYSEERRLAIRTAAFLNMIIGVLALLSVFLAKERLYAFWSGGFAGLGLLLWGGLDAYAAIARHLRGSKFIAMFMAILSIVLIGSSFLIGDGGPYRYATIILGSIAFGVSVADAIVSPAEDRRTSFEPRRPDDLAPP